jgi:SAM-dependent methyltransferase
MVLQPSEYNMSYFDGKKSSLSHNAGYTCYKRWDRYCGDILPVGESTGEFFRDIAKKFYIEHALQGKKVLELGCAYGFMIEDLRNMGVDAWGLDVSQYAYDQASDAIKPYITVADARTYLNNYANNQWDAIISRWFIYCFEDSELPALITEMNRVARFQAHIIPVGGPTAYYNIKQPQVWIDSFNWKRGTVITTDNLKVIYRK